MTPFDDMDGGDRMTALVLLATVYVHSEEPVAPDTAIRFGPLGRISVLSMVQKGCASTGAGANDDHSCTPVAAESA